MGSQLFTNAEGRLNGFLMDPNNLVIATDKGHPLYDERADWKVDESLIRNIKTYGVREPVEVRKNAEGLPEVIDGRQRVMAAREANKRLEAEGAVKILVPVIAAKVDDQRAFELQIVHNECRRANPPLVRARLMQRFMEMGRTEEMAAVAFGTSVPEVKAHLALLDAPSDVQAMVEAGKMSVTAAGRMAGLVPEKVAEVVQELDKAAKTMAEKGGTAPKKLKRSPRHTVKAVEKAVAKANGKTISDRPSTNEVRALYNAIRTPAYRETECINAAKAILAWVLDGEKRPFVKDLLASAAAEE